MAKETPGRILDECFKLFITRHYEQVSVKDMEDHLKLSRGVIFYHYRDKLDLFRHVIDKYVINKQRVYGKIEPEDVSEDTTLREFIDIYLNGAQRMIDGLYDILNGGEETPVEKHSQDRSYLELCLYAGYYYPKFNDVFMEGFDFELETWVKVITRAIKRGEIKQVDPLLVSKQFQAIYAGQAFQDSFKQGFDLPQIHDLFMGLYNLLKK